MTISIGVPEVRTKGGSRSLWFKEFTAYTEARNADGSNHISIGFDGVSAEFKPPQYSYKTANLHAYASAGDTLNKAIAINNSTIDLELDKDGEGVPPWSQISGTAVGYGHTTRALMNSSVSISKAEDVWFLTQGETKRARNRTPKGLDSITIDESRIILDHGDTSLLITNVAETNLPEFPSPVANHHMRNSFINLKGGDDYVSFGDVSIEQQKFLFLGDNTIDGGSGCDKIGFGVAKESFSESTTSGGDILLTEKATGGTLLLKNFEYITYVDDVADGSYLRKSCAFGDPSSLNGDDDYEPTQEEIDRFLEEIGWDDLEIPSIENSNDTDTDTNADTEANEGNSSIDAQGEVGTDDCGQGEFFDLVDSTRLAAYNFPSDMARDGTFEALRGSAIDFVNCSNGSIENNKPIKVNDQYSITLGTTGKDKIKGTKLDDIIYSSLGNDKIKGKRGDDIIFGSIGNDTLDGGKGDDILHGGAGADTYKVSKGKDVFMYFDPFTDKLKGKLRGATLAVVNDGIMLQHRRGSVFLAGNNDAEKLSAVESLL